MITSLTSPLQAFIAMSYFLSDYYHKTQSNGLGSLLGDMQLLENGNGTWDPAAWKRWLKIIEIANKPLTPLEAFKAMFIFLDMYHERTSRDSAGIQMVLNDIQLNKNDTPIKPDVWNKWIEKITFILKESPSK